MLAHIVPVSQVRIVVFGGGRLGRLGALDSGIKLRVML